MADLEWWKKTFPDPSDSPAYYTNALFVVCPQVIAEADAEDGSWIGAFSRVARLRVESSLDDSKVPSRHSTHSHPHSNYSAWRLPSFHPHRLSTSFVHSPPRGPVPGRPKVQVGLRRRPPGATVRRFVDFTRIYGTLDLVILKGIENIVLRCWAYRVVLTFDGSCARSSRVKVLGG